LWQQRAHLSDFVEVRRGQASLPIPAKHAFQWIRREFNRGASIILNSVHNYDAEFAAFHRQLEDELQMAVAANVYLTPPSEQTFAPHFDAHDAFVVHLHGTKRWRIHDRAVPYPLSHHAGPVDPSKLCPPVAQLDLHPGDVLYIPRGTVHWATSSTEPSLHVTLGCYPLRHVDLLEILVQLAADAIPELRQAVRVEDSMRGDAPSLSRALDLVASFASDPEASRTAVTRWVERRVARSVVVPDGGLLGLDDDSQLELDDWVERYAGLCCRVDVAHGRAKIVFGGYPSRSGDERPATFSGPSFLGETFEYIAGKSGPFTVSSLPAVMTDDSKVLLVQQLLEAGLLRRVRAQLQLADQPAAQ
jgi:hypothetical protein